VIVESIILNYGWFSIWVFDDHLNQSHFLMDYFVQLELAAIFDLHMTDADKKTMDIHFF